MDLVPVTHIKCLRPQITRLEAEKMLRGPWREMRSGAFRMAFDFYLPFHLFRVTVTNNGKGGDRFLGIDAVNGSLDIYTFDELPDESGFIEMEVASVAEKRLNPGPAFRLLETKVRRAILRQGFFKVRELKITGQAKDLFYLPFVVGVFERKGLVHLEVVNAVRGQHEGAKVRELVIEWFKRPHGEIPR